MRYVSLGERRVSVIGLGAWQFGNSGMGWGAGFGLGEVRQIIARALDLGVNLIDTAEIYSRGESERVIGEAVGNRRDEVLLATKVSGFYPVRRVVRRSAERSLKRLKMENLDLYQVHWPNLLVPASWTFGGMRDLLEAGRIHHVGVSNYGLGRWRRADEALGRPVVSNQVLYHLLDRWCERELLPHAQANSRIIIAYSPLAQGLLSGRYGPDNLPRDVRSGSPLFTAENARRAQPVLGVLREVASAHNATSAQIALAWLVRHPNVIAIPGAKSVAQLEANAAAADIDLRTDEVEALSEASDAFRPVGLNRNLPSLAFRLLSR